MISASKNLSKKAQYNLTKLQRRTLRQLKDNQQIIILNSDKNLGIASIKRDEYIKAILQEHLTKNDIYKNLTKQEAQSFMSLAESEIKMAIRENRDTIPESDARYFNRSFQKEHRFPIFYGTPKVHKDKNTLGYFPMRPVVS